MASLSRQARSIYPTDTTHTINPRAQRGTSALTLRPIRPQDQPGLAALLTGLSPQARRNRFHGGLNFSVAQRAQWSQVDSERQRALVVTARVNGVGRLIAEAHYGVDDDRCGAEFALVVDARWQRLGVGAWAMRSLQHAAARSGLQWLHGDVLAGFNDEGFPVGCEWQRGSGMIAQWYTMGAAWEGCDR